jgi:hypothetical protein
MMQTQTAPFASTLDSLIDAGFVHAGRWTKFAFESELDLDKPGVYAFVVDGAVNYIGKTDRSLAARFRSHRRRAEDAEADLRRPVHFRLAEDIYSGRTVEIYVLLCAGHLTMWRGLPVDVLSGLEAALIRQFDPPYNRASRARVRRLAA